MIVFPRHFIGREIINSLDPLQASVVWYKFKSALELHYGKHFVDTIQVASVFSSIDREQILGVRNTRHSLLTLKTPEIPAYEVKWIPFPDLHMFEKTAVDKSYLTGLDLVDNSEAILYDIFRFYLPAFIWAYNTLKLLLLEDDAALGLLDELLVAQTTGARQITFKNMCPDFSRFDLGTGCRVRRTEYFTNKMPKIEKEALQRANVPTEQIAEPEKKPFKLPKINLGFTDYASDKRTHYQSFLDDVEEVNNIYNYDLGAEENFGSGPRSRKKQNIGSGRSSRK